MANIEDLGISFIHSQVAKMGCFFREQPKHDFGIDAHIETANAAGKGTGRNIAVQIKSGSSYVKENEQGGIVHYTDERHIQYWAEHSLPVILIVYDPEQEIAWWCDVKAYISRHPSLLSQGPYKVILPNTQQFTAESRDDLITLATVPQFPLTMDRQHFSIISTDDISTAQAKRYRAEILVGNVNNDMVRLAIYQATEHLKHVVEHSSDRRAAHWGDQQPHLVTLFVYRDLDDRAHTNWIARSIWRDPNNEGAKLVNIGKMNDYTEDIEIDFADSQKQQGWRQFIAERVITKYQFLKKVEQWIAISDDLVDRAVALTQERDAHQITEEAYVETMSGLAQAYAEQVEHKYDDGTTGPSEVRDAEMRYAATIGSGGNVFIAFTPRGLETWTDPKRRDYLVKSYLKRYKEDREMLGFELKKLSG
jgi:hypothetical protein